MGTQLPLKGHCLSLLPRNFPPESVVAKRLDGSTCHLVTEKHLTPGDIVSDGNRGSLQKGGTAPPPIFNPFLSRPNGWMHQDTTWYGGRPRSRLMSRPNGWVDQDATWYGSRRRPRRHCVRWGSMQLRAERGTSPQFSAHVYCGQTVAHLSC